MEQETELDVRTYKVHHYALHTVSNKDMVRIIKTSNKVSQLCDKRKIMYYSMGHKNKGQNRHKTHTHKHACRYVKLKH